MHKYQTVRVTAFEQNCFVVWCDETLKAAVIDPGGDRIRSMTQRLWPMGNDKVFIPGHDPESTFGRERQTHPFAAGT